MERDKRKLNTAKAQEALYNEADFKKFEMDSQTQ